MSDDEAGVPPLKRPSVMSATSCPAAAHDGAGRAEHLAHAGAADGAFMADDDHVPLLDPAAQNRIERVFFAIEHERLSSKALALLAADFRNRAIGREIAVQDDEMAVALDRRIEAANDVLPVWIASR